MDCSSGNRPLAKINDEVNEKLMLLASARKNSDTEKFLAKAFERDPYTLVDLLDSVIAPYRYDGRYPPDDDFFRIAEWMTRHEMIVFATPVYWYAMSGLMKNFFDRLTDLITIRKDLGRQLKGRKTLLLAVGADEELPEGFEIPFKLTSEYLGMVFTGKLYSSVKQ